MDQSKKRWEKPVAVLAAAVTGTASIVPGHCEDSHLEHWKAKEEPQNTLF
jgi:hypothetical protein